MTLAAPRADDAPTERPAHQDRHIRRLARPRVAGSPQDTARLLLGSLVVREDETGRRIARIVETEAYAGPEDRASHARAGRTRRTRVMFGPAGCAYVYLVYGLHHCLNVVCGDDGEAAAVLIRAVEPVQGIATMRTRRGAAAGPDMRLAAGPARTCQALDIDVAHDGLDLIDGQGLWLATDGSGPLADDGVVAGPRIGVDYAGPEWSSRAWRFGVAGSQALSRPFPVTA